MGWDLLWDCKMSWAQDRFRPNADIHRPDRLRFPNLDLRQRRETETEVRGKRVLEPVRGL